MCYFEVLGMVLTHLLNLMGTLFCTRSLSVDFSFQTTALHDSYIGSALYSWLSQC